jgi:hypothetical protein
MVITVPGLDLPDLFQHAPYWILQWSLIMFPSALLLVATPKSSVLRLAWIPCCLFLLHNLLKDLLSCSSAFSVRNVLGGMFMIETQHLLSVFIFLWPDSEELEQGKVYEAIDGLTIRVFRTVGFFYNLRGIGTSWQVKRINAHPGFLSASGDGGKPDRARFIVRQLAIISWQWLLLDLVYEGALQQGPDEKFATMGSDLEFVYRDLSADQWAHRFIAGFASGWALQGCSLT